VDEIAGELGANGPFSTCRVKGFNFALRETQLFLVANPQDPWFVNGAVLDQFQLLENASLEDLHMVHDRGRQRIVLFGKSAATSAWDWCYACQYGTTGAQAITGAGEAGVDPLDVRVLSWYKIVLPSEYLPCCSLMAEQTADLPELWIAGADNYLYKIGDATQTGNERGGLADVASQAIIQFAAVPLGHAPGGRGTPRYLEFNAEASAQTTWTVDITLLSDAGGATLGTAQFTVVIGSGSTSHFVPIPACGRGEWCVIKFSENTVAGVGTFKGPVILHYVPRYSRRLNRSA
jgi:hypothetical protein